MAPASSGSSAAGPADNTIGSDRTDGMLSQVEPTDIEVITYPDFAGWSTDGGFTAAETLLAQNPDLNAIFCENDSMCLGAQKVIEDQGLADQVFVVGVDGEKAALVEIMKDGVYKATGLNSSDQIGRAGFNRLMAILAGANAEKDTVMPVAAHHDRQRPAVLQPRQRVLVGIAGVPDGPLGPAGRR